MAHRDKLRRPFMPGDAHAAAVKLAAGVIASLGLGALAVVLWICRRMFVLERRWDIGDLAVPAVFTLFGAICLWWGWRLSRGGPDTLAPAPLSAPPPGPATADAESPAPSRRVSLSHGFAAAGVLLLLLAMLIPEQWHPVVLLFTGLAFLAASHVLTPCVERLEKLRKARASMRQL